MKVLFKLNHPAHYHLFKNVIFLLKQANNEVLIVIKNKDILQELLDSEGVPYIKIAERIKRKAGNKISIIVASILELLKEDFKLFWIVKNWGPHMMLGTDISIAHIGWLLNIPSFIFNEDDYNVNKLFCSFTYPFCNFIVSPKVCDVGKFSKKKIEYNGYQKLAYLHPNFFTPDKNIVENYIPLNRRYFLLRLVNFTAVHDIERNHKGITYDLIKELITILKSEGDVYITAENDLLNYDLRKYQLKINPKDIHHILAYADLIISDSQSMTVEAAMLGTPSIRFSSFVGKISVLNELENIYNLTIGIDINNPELLIETVKDLVKKKNLKEEFQKRRNKMLKDKINLTEFILSLISRYNKR